MAKSEFFFGFLKGVHLHCCTPLDPPLNSHNCHGLKRVAQGWVSIGVERVPFWKSQTSPRGCVLQSETPGQLSCLQILARRSESIFPVKYLKGIGCEWDLLHGMSSNYPQTAGKRNPFMHNCERECCWILFSSWGHGSWSGISKA